MVSVSLSCASIGKTSVFGVKIDDGVQVWVLMDAIKAKSSVTITCDVKDLQLFLAKKEKGFGVWLTENDVKNGVSDTSDLELLDTAGAPLHMVGLSKEDVWFRVTKENIKAKTIPVHVLVKVPPPEENTFPPYAVIAAAMFQHTFLNVPSTTTSRTQKLRKRLVKNYKCDCGRNENDDSMMLCMVLGVALPSTVVIASHIFRQEHDSLKDHFVQIADIDDVRNGLLLFKPIKSAFDDLDISVLVDKRDRFTLKLFNPDIKDHLLVDWLTEEQWNDLGGGSLPTNWRTSTTPIYAPNAPQFNVLTTFSELDGKTLQFPTGSTLRPFRCCLYLQAQLGRTRAITQGWVLDYYNFDDFSSEGLALEEKMRLLFSRIVSTSGSPS